MKDLLEKASKDLNNIDDGQEIIQVLNGELVDFCLQVVKTPRGEDIISVDYLVIGE